MSEGANGNGTSEHTEAIVAAPQIPIDTHAEVARKAAIDAEQRARLKARYERCQALSDLFEGKGSVQFVEEELFSIEVHLTEEQTRKLAAFVKGLFQ